jgi:hypothetical protein
VFAAWISFFDVTESDNKPRGVHIREASRLRATLGSEPSSGYAFHDHVRVERVRPGQREPAAQVASHAPRERAFAHTLVGGVTIQEALGTQPPSATAPSPAPTANDQGDEGGARVSWPPMPQVPSELEGSVVDALPGLTDFAAEADVPTGVRSTASSSAPAKRVSSGPPAVAVPAGGAIWQAMPSLVDAPVAIETIAARDSAAELRTTPMPAEPKPHSRPATHHRPSAAELEADYAHSYGDQRVLKYEKLVERNAWEQLAEQLGQEQELSPALLLLRIVAQREMLKGDQKQEAARLAQQGISAVARVLQLPEASPTALVLGKRLLRRNPGWVPQRRAGTGLSVGLLLGGLTLGAAIGWLITALIF